MGNNNSKIFEELPLNPMVFHPRFLHISEKIFDKMDDKCLKNCREITKSWQIAIDNKNTLWNKIATKNGGTETLQKACKKI